LQKIFASIRPLIGLQMTGLVLVMFFPEIALWLPALLHGQAPPPRHVEKLKSLK
jgi:TRAP-type mannitol/chloroaromatic compound transport system permease large subunit